MILYQIFVYFLDSKPTDREYFLCETSLWIEDLNIADKEEYVLFYENFIGNN